MTRLVIRHGLSEANNRENYGTPAFGNPNATLMDEGIVHATNTGNRLRLPLYSIDSSNTIVAVSKMRRTWETANFAGFHTLRPYELLNEISHGLTLDDKANIKKTGIIPEIALEAARDILKNPPEEEIWFTHGLVIASICKVRNIYQDPKYSLIPAFGEIRELPL
jgi:broad specificity phosphatase PhoE